MKRLFLFALVILCSCNTQKKCEKHIAKAKQLGCLNIKDSTSVVIKYIKGDTVYNSETIYVDSSQYDSLQYKDTCFTKERIQTIIKTLKLKPIDVKNKNYDLKIWVDNGKINYNIITPPRIDTTIQPLKVIEIIKPPVTVKEIPIWIVALVVVFGIITLMVVLKSKGF